MGFNLLFHIIYFLFLSLFIRVKNMEPQVVMGQLLKGGGILDANMEKMLCLLMECHRLS